MIKEGDKFGRLTAVKYIGRSSKNKYIKLWKFRCICGNIIFRQPYKVTSGHTSSCGCYLIDFAKKAFTTHGQSSSLIYRRWAAMLDRCTRKKHKYYKNYGGRGIKVCKRWYKFENFLKDMSPLPSPQHTLERVNNTKNYTKTNCKWATRTEQNRNTRSTRFIKYRGEVKSLAEWAEIHKVKYMLIWTRLSLGWSPEKALEFKGDGRFKKHRT